MRQSDITGGENSIAMQQALKAFIAIRRNANKHFHERFNIQLHISYRYLSRDVSGRDSWGLIDTSS